LAKYALLFFYRQQIVRSFVRYILSMQNEDGGWGTTEIGPSTMFGSCMNYVTLRLLGEVCTHDALAKGREWILSHGSAAAIPQWGKIWLSVCHQIIDNLIYFSNTYIYKIIS
jgi:squalene cyclase